MNIIDAYFDFGVNTDKMLLCHVRRSHTDASPENIDLSVTNYTIKKENIFI